jgi:hypothetical protein
MKHARGFTLVDTATLLIVVILAVWDGFFLNDALDVSRRGECYVNQAALDRALWDASSQRKRDVADVLAAYAVQYTDRAPQLVILYRQRGAAERAVVVVDLSDRKEPIRALCPMHTAARTRPAIDYWYAFGKWHCLFNKWHSA